MPDLEKVRISFNDMWKDMCGYVREIWKLRQNKISVTDKHMYSSVGAMIVVVVTVFPFLV